MLNDKSIVSTRKKHFMDCHKIKHSSTTDLVRTNFGHSSKVTLRNQLFLPGKHSMDCHEIKHSKTDLLRTNVGLSSEVTFLNN